MLWPKLATGKEVWEYPHSLRKFYGANPESLPAPRQRAEARQLEHIRRNLTAKSVAAVNAGKTVANLQSRDPMIYGMTLFLELLPAATPVAVVCDAGDPARERIIRSTVARFLAEADYKPLPVNRHRLFVGKFLEVGQKREDFTPRITDPERPH